ncbi:ubiquitin carboxyl-terminal hydrolase 48-like [Sycon ciliatum]|uniref:ubiquitin carboxyl-terminal hydrolase 48-like n=1 Tax=Sycon ciliatum TaxID=27933 RepID=UPI0031F658C5
MAPKAVLEKKAWEWTGRIPPENVQQEHLVLAYRLNLLPCKSGSCKRNCRGNPSCLQGLGERHWFSEASDASFNDSLEPESERRDESQCVGLRNLGATCYYNTLLQLWFHDPTFRSALYQWNEDEDPMVCAARHEQRQADEKRQAADDKQRECSPPSSSSLPTVKSSPSPGVATVAATTAGLSEIGAEDEEEAALIRQAIAISMEDCERPQKDNGEVAVADGDHSAAAVNGDGDTDCSVSKVVASAEVPEEPVSPLMKSVCGQLRLLFAKLQLSKRRYIDTVDFSTTLGLNINQQQDAQEFCQLFISLLQTQLSSQSNASVKNLIQNQFGGRFAYVTKCASCSAKNVNPSTFYQLDLSIQQHDSLTDCLRDYLKEEILDGDNQYSCGRCAKKRDGTRHMELLTLPPVLNFQLMRFIFDRKTFQKKKAKSWCQFPEELDMSEFVHRGGTTESMYDLTGVLIHCGPSAYSGHYVAHIQNTETKQWWQFNDESTEVMSGSKLHLGLNKMDVGKLKGRKTQKGWHTSNDAYMLVYTRRTASQPAATLLSSPPEEVKSLVDKDNEELEDWIENTKCCQMENVESGRQKRLEKQTLYSLLNVTPADKDFRFIKTSWLQTWLDEETSDEAVDALSDSDIRCVHGNLDVAKIDLVKRISITAATELISLYGGDLHLGKDSLCRECVVLKCRHMRFQSKLAEDVRQVSAVLKAKSSDSSSSAFWIGKTSLQRWRRFANDDFLSRYPLPVMRSPCPEDDSPASPKPDDRSFCHNMESDSPPEDLAKEPTDENALHEQQSSADNVSTTAAIATTTATPTAAGDGTEEVPSSSSGSPGGLVDHTVTNGVSVNDGAVVPSAGTAAGDNAECGDSTLTKAEDAIDMPADEQMKFNEECVCVHDCFSVDQSVRRLIPANAWRIIRPYMTDATEYPVNQELCSKCQETRCEEESLELALRLQASEQKEAYASLLMNRSQDAMLQPGESCAIFYIVAGDFLDKLKRFIRSNGQSGIPECIDNSAFVCGEHGQLIYNVLPDDDEQLSDDYDCPRFSYVTEHHWQDLQRYYSCRNALSVQLSRDLDPSIPEEQLRVDQCSSPSLCMDCYSQRLADCHKKRLEYSEATVYIRQVESNPTSTAAMTTDGSNSHDPIDLDAPPTKRLCVNPEEGGSLGVRRSTRQRRCRNSISIRVSSTEPLIDLKLKLMRHITAAPFDQHLAIEEDGGKCTELLDDKGTLSAQGVAPNASLLVWVDKPVATEVEELAPVDTTPEEGFKGTVLLS